MAQDSEFQDIEVRSFGGGLNLAEHPAYIADNQWSWCENVYAAESSCEAASPFELKIPASSFGTLYALTGLGCNPSLGFYGIVTYLYMGTPPPALEELYLGKFVSNIENPTLAAIPPATTRAYTQYWARPQFAYQDNKILCAAGWSAPASPTSLVWMPPATLASYSLITPGVGYLRPDHLVMLGGHVIAAPCAREGTVWGQEHQHIAWANASAPLVWDPGLDNSADDVYIEDSESGITAVAKSTGDLVLIFTRNQIFGLRPTGSIPAYTLQLLVGQVGAPEQSPWNVPGLAGACARGVLFFSGRGFSVFDSSVVHISASLGGYPTELFNTVVPSPACIHNNARRAQVVISLGNVALCWNPYTGAWSRLSWPTMKKTGETLPLEWVRAFQLLAPGYHYDAGDWWAAAAYSGLWRECPATIAMPANTAFVDTKDFHLGHDVVEMDSLLLDWEPLTSSSTDAIEVLAHGRNEFSPARLGKIGGQMDDLAFTSIGTLTGGSAELPIRRSYRYQRFRFRNASGRFRIRGFKLRGKRGADR